MENWCVDEGRGNKTRERSLFSRRTERKKTSLGRRKNHTHYGGEKPREPKRQGQPVFLSLLARKEENGRAHHCLCRLCRGSPCSVCFCEWNGSLFSPFFLCVIASPASLPSFPLSFPSLYSPSLQASLLPGMKTTREHREEKRACSNATQRALPRRQREQHLERRRSLSCGKLPIHESKSKVENRTTESTQTFLPTRIFRH